MRASIALSIVLLVCMGIGAALGSAQSGALVGVGLGLAAWWVFDPKFAAFSRDYWRGEVWRRSESIASVAAFLNRPPLRALPINSLVSSQSCWADRELRAHA